VAEFIIATPDLVVQSITFQPLPWITTTPEQGELSFTLANAGNASSGTFRVLIHDVFIPQQSSVDTVRSTLLETSFVELAAGEDTTFHLPWKTIYSGKHRIDVNMDPDNNILELDKINNLKRELVVSIPKGRITTDKSVDVIALGFDVTEIPVVPEVYFEPNSSRLQSEYTSDKGALPSVLYTLSERLLLHDDVVLQIMGSVDEMSDETDLALAQERAEAVKDGLGDLGVPESQLTIISNHDQKVQGRGRRPEDHPDSKWIMEQNRKVTFRVLQEHELSVFGPLTVEVDTTLRDSIPFSIQIYSPAAVDNWNCQIDPDAIRISRNGFTGRDSLWSECLWDGTGISKNELVPRNRWYQYRLTLTDTLNRTFQTYADSVYLNQKRTIRRREIFGAAKFAKVEPVYKFYWDRLMELADELAQNPKLRITFEGHACAVGSDMNNLLLSQKRARRFSNAFRERVRSAYPNRYSSILRRIEMPVGFGEKEPLRVKLKGQRNTLLGDNESPVGRYLNRRIMVLLYTED